MKKTINNSGFSLVELAVCLIIIGLMAGAILIGQGLVGTSKMQGLVKQLSQYDKGVDAFTLKYGRLPADSSKVTPSGATAGNNNMLIDTASTFTPSSEFASFWAVLSMTGLKTEDTANTHYSPTVVAGNFPMGGNAPESQLGNNAGIIAMGGTGGSAGTVANVLAGAGHIANFYFIADCSLTTSGTTSCTNGIPGVDAISFDKKLDDGVATSGKVVGYQIGGSAANSFSAIATAATSTYIATSSKPGPSRGSVLIVRMGTQGDSLR